MNSYKGGARHRGKVLCPRYCSHSNSRNSNSGILIKWSHGLFCQLSFGLVVVIRGRGVWISFYDCAWSIQQQQTSRGERQG